MLPIGVMVNNLEPDRLTAFRVAADLGFRIVHTGTLPEAWLTGSQRQQYVDAARSSGIQIHSMFVGFDGQSYANLEAIRRTVGLLNPEFQEHRIGIASRYADLARELGAPCLAAHIGFIPETASDPQYTPLVTAVRRVADAAAARGLTLNLETGQEPAAVLMHFLGDVARRNVGVNFDPGNFLLYGTDDPLPALRILQPWVRGVHCKDGKRPEESGLLGREPALGHGDVPMAEVLAELLQAGYSGPLVIERERSPHAVAEILAARDLLQTLLSKVDKSGRLFHVERS